MSKLVLVLVVISIHAGAQKKVPLPNQKVVEYVQSVMGTQVGLGECSDLIMMAQFQIRNIAAKEPIIKIKQKQEVLPGDFMGFNDVVVGGLYFPQHFAIIMEVEAPNVYVIAHQNHNGNKTVQQMRLDLNNISRGKVNITRPTNVASRATVRPSKKKPR